MATFLCNNCPRACNVDRSTTLGFCRSSLLPEVSAICAHRGEEPPLSGAKGVCNLFFAHCNLQCLYCQNLEISRAAVAERFIHFSSVDDIVAQIEHILPTTENILGFVSPTHYAHLIPPIVERLHSYGHFPTVVYNTNAYDSLDTLRRLAPYVDVYLPDLKYLDPSLANSLSHAADYPLHATRAILEMVNQKGSNLLTDENELAFRGIIVRHLILPGHVGNSLRVLDWIADNLPHNIHVSLMAQYYPPAHAPLPHELQRPITQDEYTQVVDHFAALGLYNGWIQDLQSNLTYRPNFSSPSPFENSLPLDQ